MTRRINVLAQLRSMSMDCRLLQHVSYVNSENVLKTFILLYNFVTVNG